MLHSTFVLSLLASAVSARGLSIGLPDLPSFMLVAPGATIDPISSRVSTVRPTPTLTPTPTPTPSPVDEDQPDPYNSSVQLPASESFNPSKAPAFTQIPGMPNISIGPVFSSEPCSTSTTVTPKPKTSEPCTEESSTPSGTPLPITPTSIPTGGPPPPIVESGFPTFVPPPSFTLSSTIQASGTPLPITPTSIPTGGPPPPIVQSGFPTFVPPPSFTLSSSTRTSCTPLPISPSSIPTGGSPAPLVSSGFPTFVPRPSTTLAASSRPAYKPGNSFPTYIPRPNERPAYGAGRPRPMGAWPSRPRPSRAHVRPHRHSAGAPHSAGPSAGKVNATSTPCTLETRVRPTPTGV